MGIGGALDLDIIYDARKIGLLAGLIALKERQRDKAEQTYSQQRPADPEFFARAADLVVFFKSIHLKVFFRLIKILPDDF